jgi:hypothetical protein
MPTTKNRAFTLFDGRSGAVGSTGSARTAGSTGAARSTGSRETIATLQRDMRDETAMKGEALNKQRFSAGAMSERRR